MSDETLTSGPDATQPRKIDMDGIVARMKKVRAAMDKAGMTAQVSTASIAEYGQVLDGLDLSALDLPDSKNAQA